MKKTNRKGFTIVELVIVIAVIAILAAVLIPTFSSLIKKANISNDIVLVKNMNTVLATEEVLNGKNVTMSDALEDVFKAGYSVDKLSPTTSNYKIVWDQEKNRLALLREDNSLEFAENNEISNSNVWMIVHKYNEIAGADDFSVYLAEDFDATGMPEELAITGGFDCGNVTVVNSLSYTNSGAPKEVTIRTNGGTLTINAPLDTVNHYGYAEVVDIAAVASASYHENGTASFISIKEGRVVLTKESSVNTIFVEKNTNTSFATVKVALVGSAQLPTIKRDEIDLTPGAPAITVVELQNLTNAGEVNESEFITISKDSVSEEVVVEVKDGSDNTVVTPKLANEDVTNIVKDEASKEEAKDEATMFAGGDGTEENPYLIANREQLENISKTNESGDNSFSGYFKVIDGVTEIDCSDWNSGNLVGNFDGNGVVLNNLDSNLFAYVYGFGASNSVLLSNFTVNIDFSSSQHDGLINWIDSSSAIFKNVTVHGTIHTDFPASFLGYGPGLNKRIDITFDNCYSDAYLISTSGGCGGFIAHPYWAAGSTLTINDSIFCGRMSVPSGQSYKYYKLNSANDGSTYLYETYSEGFFTKYGYSSIEELRGASNNMNAIYKDENKKSVITTVPGSVNPEIGGIFSVAQVTGAVRAEASLVIGPNDKNETGNYTNTYFTDKNLILEDGQFKTDSVKHYEVSVNDPDLANGVTGNKFNIVRDVYGTTFYTYVVKVVQYDSNGNIIHITTFNLK